MSYKFSENEISMFYDESFKENNFIFPKQKGYLKIDKTKITDEILLFRNTAFANDNVEIIYNDNDFYKNTIYIAMTINGALQVVTNEHELTYERSKTIIHQNENFQSTNFKICKNQNILGLSFVVKKSFFDKSNINISDNYIIKNTTSNLKSNILAKQILSSPYKGVLNEIYIQSKALEIIFLELLGLKEKPKNTEAKFSEFDINALYKAKQILENQSHFPSIYKLSRMVSLNEFKLKFGFRKYFAKTPYQISLNARLENAKKLLQKDSLSIAEISQKTGFKHQQSFSVAFSKHFGILPKDMRKTRKFYL